MNCSKNCFIIIGICAMIYNIFATPININCLPSTCINNYCCSDTIIFSSNYTKVDKYYCSINNNICSSTTIDIVDCTNKTNCYICTLDLTINDTIYDILLINNLDCLSNNDPQTTLENIIDFFSIPNIIIISIVGFFLILFLYSCCCFDNRKPPVDYNLIIWNFEKQKIIN